MKLLVYRVNNRKKNKKKNSKISFEKTLFISFIIMFTILIITQTALMSPNIENYISVDNQYERSSLGAEEFLYKRGEVSLQLQNMDSDDKLKVLINGEVIGAFVNKTLSLNVRDGDVIELDASDISTMDEVKIISKSDNIISDILNKEIKVLTGVKKLTIIQIK